MNKATEDLFVAILQEELLCATGCTEPIAVAYAASYARDVLQGRPDKICIAVSGNIIKNVKSVVVPNTQGRKGIAAAVSVGVVAGKTERLLQVIATVSDEERAQIPPYLSQVPIEVSCLESEYPFDMVLKAYLKDDWALVRIAAHHTNIVRVEHNGTVLVDHPVTSSSKGELHNKGALNLHDILSFADTVPLKRVQKTLDRQIACNTAIAEEGLRNSYGANVGKTMMELANGEPYASAGAFAAAGSDARMSGCDMPVVICSGSGNQGMTASLPVIYYARHMGVTQEKLYRALILSSLVTIYQKVSIGRLSAFCGAVSAGCGAAAGIAYLQDDGPEVIEQTIQNALAIAPGIVCDGAKPSCAAKIAIAVEAGTFGYRMCKKGQYFYGGDGIVQPTADDTIRSVGRIASEGMRTTDQVIIDIMRQTE